LRPQRRIDSIESVQPLTMHGHIRIEDFGVLLDLYLNPLEYPSGLCSFLA
jgi:hypothetical protein